MKDKKEVGKTSGILSFSWEIYCTYDQAKIIFRANVDSKESDQPSHLHSQVQSYKTFFHAQLNNSWYFHIY